MKKYRVKNRIENHVKLLMMLVIGLILIIGGLIVILNRQTRYDLRSRATSNNPCSVIIDIPTSTPTITITPTLTPPSSSCMSWGTYENSGSFTHITKIDILKKIITLVSQHYCNTGDKICEIEAMDSHPVTGVIYATSQKTRGLYIVNKTDGSLTLVKTLSPSIFTTAINFRKNDNSLWAFGNNGIYKINVITGVATLIKGRTWTNPTVDMEGIAWDNDSKYLYLTRDVNSVHELWRYNPADNSMVLYANNLPGTTDDMDFAPSDYLGGYLVGNYKGTGKVTFYTYNVASRSVVAYYPITTTYNNVDAFAICVTK
jgi:hypothetical protein